MITPLEINMEAQHDAFQKDIPFPGTHFQVPCETSGVYSPNLFFHFKLEFVSIPV